MCPVIQPPNGTRDLYPIEAARRRFITEAWRKVSINHGFEEIDGPTFEHLELYTVKSGDGIVSELFSFRREGGEKDFALRPEFTPTLARMYAAKAKSLPKPTKWFTAGPFFRAERPQRGRLREFLQWNCDVIGLAPTADNSQVDGMECRVQADADVITCCVELLAACGLTSADVRVAIGSREVVANVMLATGVSRDDILKAMNLLDRRAKLDSKTFEDAARSLNWDIAQFDSATQSGSRMIDSDRGPDLVTLQAAHKVDVNFWSINLLLKELEQRGIRNWCKADFSIARGLAYYTGVVFEVIVDGERAVAGGGRYDNLIEMFGGPSTPAVGFGMGDVVLSLVLQGQGLDAHRCGTA
jgi:histidyl-tRNA synthetase